ncbi:hypothetical protein RJ640_012292 [Escallonia rubra]|uniref:Uncharacterized protein n=1 Tax=Escallonia rubra TaxID=112253 RepID=A0AA88QB48_9ASTE|nr:hypothetical protein RJ640_012292 [Escallonia rubra]
MSANEWDALPYNRVASVAMKNYKELFLKHSPERFKEYLENVRKEKAKIVAGALLPREIIKDLKKEESREVAELQWKRMVDDVAKKGKLSNCIAICDVSGSMDGVPMEVSVALGVLISELSEEPWKGKLITFSADPELQKLECDTLLAKTEFVRKMDWGVNTDFQKVFDRILEIAVEGELSEDQMIKRVFVFSDMEFDVASQNPWETDYQAIQRKFGEKGYQSVPEIVFWNLRHSPSTPVVARQSGVALVSGFSKNLLTIFLEGGGVVNPEEVMAMAIAGEEYKNLCESDGAVNNRIQVWDNQTLDQHGKSLKFQVYMSANKWDSIPYDQVPSIAMKNYTDIFLHRGNERSRNYLVDVIGGNVKIAAGACFRMISILPRWKVVAERLYKAVFVFSDIKFDQASANPWETDYQAIKRKFSERGYENIPEIMFWNLSHSSATHVTATRNGVALLSGYSKNLLTLFLEKDGVINPKDLAKQSKPEVCGP